MSNTITSKILNTTPNQSMIILRIVAGVIFAAHGAQKLFAWFGGYGLEGTGQWMDSIGLTPGYYMAMLAGSAEFFGGILLIVGFLTRPSAVVLAITMFVAIFSFHIGNGLFMANNGFEFGLALFAMCIALVLHGGGSYSLDRMVTQKNLID